MQAPNHSPNSEELLPLLPEAKKQLVDLLNARIEEYLQSINYPVGFRDIQAPKVPTEKLEGKSRDSMSGSIILSDAGKKIILDTIKHAL